MEELKLLIEMVKGLPQMALWVVVLFFAYKVAVVGSIFGLIKLGINKLHSYFTTPKHELKTVDVTAELEDITIRECYSDLLRQIKRLVGRTTSIPTDYIHKGDVKWLRAAIDEKLEREKKIEGEEK